ACQPKLLVLRRLQVKPDGLAISAEELMPGDFHVHGARVDLAQALAVGASGPDTVYLMPGPLMTEHDQRWIRRRELHVVQPVGRGMNFLAPARCDGQGVAPHRRPARAEAPAPGLGGWLGGLAVILAFGFALVLSFGIVGAAGEQCLARVAG